MVLMAIGRRKKNTAASTVTNNKMTIDFLPGRFFQDKGIITFLKLIT
jgi:hypothetical protein